MKKIFTPFGKVEKQTTYMIIVIQILIMLSLWYIKADGLYPTPINVFTNFINFLSSGDFYDNLFSSLFLTCRAMLISIVIALLFAYSYTLPFFKPLVEFISKCRYLTLTGILFVFMLVLQNGSSVKLSVLIFGIVPFFVTSLLSVICNISTDEINQGKSLKLTPWENLYQTVILGRLDQAVEVMRQNFAIAWMMITTVESMSMANGGIGVALFKFNKYNDINNIFALQLVILLIGLFTDYSLRYLRGFLFPYTLEETNKAKKKH